MLKSIIRKAAVLTAVPAVAVIGLAVTTSAASATTGARHNGIGATMYSTYAAGYETSGRDFRYITSKITIPDWPSGFGGFSLYPQSYIQLSEGSLNNLLTPSGDEYVRVGVEPCDLLAIIIGGSTCTPGSWVAFASLYNGSLNGPVWNHYVDLANVSQGDGVDFSIYFDQAGNELHFTITPPATSGPETFWKTQAYGPLFDHADAVDDWLSTTGQPVPLPPGFNPIKINSFYQGAETTYSGAKGSFTGPWTTREVQATSNGLAPPDGTLRVDPGALFSDGKKVNGAVRANDAFGPVTAVG